MRRANGTGSIVKLSGNRRRPYLVKISARDKDGYVRQVALSYHAKLQEAQDALEEYNRKAAAGQTPSADMLSWTVEQVYAAWSEREYPRSGKSSVASHKASWNQRVSRYAARKMRSVTLDEWQAILDEGEDEGRSQSSINNDAILIRALHAYAMKRDIIGKDYSRIWIFPPSTSRSKRGRSMISSLPNWRSWRGPVFPAHQRPWFCAIPACASASSCPLPPSLTAPRMAATSSAV